MIPLAAGEIGDGGHAFDRFDYTNDGQIGDQSAQTSVDFEPTFGSRSCESDPIRDIALTLLIQAARDIDRGRKVEPFTGMVISRTAEAERAELWLEYIDEGKFPFRLVCMALWGDEICAQTIGDAIIINPTIASSLEIPRPPQSYQFLRSAGH